MLTASLRLTEPTAEFKQSYLDMAREYVAFDSGRHVPLFMEALHNFDAHLKTLRDVSQGRNLPPRWVPSCYYWLVDDNDEIIGSSRLRLRLNHFLLQEGGHIGYDIRPTRRGRGFGKHILSLTLERARITGMKMVWIMCENDNLASRAIIEAHNGTLCNKIVSTRNGKLIRRYKINPQINNIWKGGLPC